MKAMNRHPINISSASKHLFIVLIAPTFLCGCTVTKILTSSYTPIDTGKYTSISLGMTREEVDRAMGKPDEKTKNKYTYMYIDIYAKRNHSFMQSAFIEFDGNDAVNGTCYVNVITGSDENYLSNSIEELSSLEIGKTTSSQVQNIVYPTRFTEIYIDGSMLVESLTYDDNNTTYRSLEELPYIDTTTNEDGTTDYTLHFDGKGKLLSLDGAKPYLGELEKMKSEN